jgi:hypothetical protein
MKILDFFLFLWVIFAFLDPDPTTQINADPDPDPKPCLLVVDTPPGTSDEHIAVMEALKGVAVDGAVLVTTPQVLKHILDSRVIHMFLGLPDPDPLARRTDPDMDTSIIKQKK